MRDTASPVIVPINVQVTPRDRRRLRQLSLDTGLSLQKLGHEAWNRLLEARGLEPLEGRSPASPVIATCWREAASGTMDATT